MLDAASGDEHDIGSCPARDGIRNLLELGERFRQLQQHQSGAREQVAVEFVFIETAESGLVRVALERATACGEVLMHADAAVSGIRQRERDRPVAVADHAISAPPIPRSAASASARSTSNSSVASHACRFSASTSGQRLRRL